MVAVAPRPAADVERSRARPLSWTVGAAAVLLIGIGVRLAVGGVGVGDRSAVAMTVLLSAAAWAAARLFGGPRVALFVTVGVVALLDLAALPQRSPPPYDDLEAFYTTDQVLAVRVPPVAGVDGGAVVTVMAQPVFVGDRPRFGLAADVDGTALAWTCAFGHGIQSVALPLPGGVVNGGTSTDVRLHLTGAPSHDGDYLIVYASSRRGGFLVALAPTAEVDRSATRCALA